MRFNGVVLMKINLNKTLFTSLITLGVASVGSAATLTAEGYVTSSSGSVGALVSPGTFATATSHLPDTIFDDNYVDGADLESLLVNAGSICITTDISNCPGSVVPVASDPGPNGGFGQEGTEVDLLSGGQFIVSGELFGVTIPLVMTFSAPLSDVTEGTTRTITGLLDFSASAGWLGGAAGYVNYTLTGTVPAVISDPISDVPVPASVWFMGSALLGLASVAKRKR